MSEAIITVEKLSKRYRLGEIGVTSLRESAERWKTRVNKWTSGQVNKWMGMLGAGSMRVRGYGSKGDGDTQTPKHPNTDTSSRSDEIWALRDVSFEVKRGEVLGIIGKNGAGKSTLLKILSRITEPTSGRAIMRGRVGSLLEVGTGFHPELTGRDNIYLSGAILGMRKAEIAKKFDEIVAFAEIDKFIDTPVKRYSSGMYVRLAFAVAAHLDPEILLVDEVLAVGDAAFQKKCLGKMSDVSHKEGRTVLFVSHNMGAISQLCGEAIWIDNGQIKSRSSARDTIDRYLSSGAISGFSRIWDDSTGYQGCDQMRFTSIRVLDSNGNIVRSVSTNENIAIELSIEILQDMNDINIAIGFYSVDGPLIFSSFFDQMDVAWSKGIYRLRCEIPANFLNAVTYHIGIYADIHNNRILIRDDSVLKIGIGSFKAIGPYPDQWGFIRPELNWERVKVEE